MTLATRTRIALALALALPLATLPACSSTAPGYGTSTSSTTGSALHSSGRGGMVDAYPPLGPARLGSDATTGFAGPKEGQCKILEFILQW